MRITIIFSVGKVTKARATKTCKLSNKILRSSKQGVTVYAFVMQLD